VASDHRPPPTFDEDDDRTLTLPSFGPGAFFAERYRIDSVLGSGAMGRVYAALELHSGNRVALKILHKERLGEPDTLERFRREAEVLASIGHPCIVEIHAFHHTSDGTPYLAMELLEGVTLKTRLTNAGRFEDPREFQPVLDCVCGALGAAHRRGIVHRDMKPDNVFLPATGEPRAKLVDFGLSRMQAQNKSLTRSGMILGTPRYMAPEQLRNAASAGPSVDVYSTGVLLYESLTGQSPYPAQDYGQLLGCVMEGRVTPIERWRPELATIGAVVARAMEADPSTRFASCDELADAYASAVGTPSRRAAIVGRGSGLRARRAAPPNAALVRKGSTLAFDASALGELPDLHEAAPLFPYGSSADAPVAYPPPPMDPPRKGGDTLFLPAEAPPAPSPSAMPHAPRSPPPASFSIASQAGGSYDARSPVPPQSFAQPAPAPKKSGVVLFLVAMVLVIVLSAAGGLALRAYMRGDLRLPSLERSS
jgi:serine/threonine-protein kinase